MDLYPDIDQLQNKTTAQAVYFFTDAVNVLNNWSAHAIDMFDRRFPTVEHAFHFKKFENTRPDVAAQVLEARSPYEAMKIAKKFKQDRRSDWEDVKVGIMTEIVRQKVLQNQDVRDIVMATGVRQLIENSPWDSFWGCGNDGRGRNIAGKILMQIRDELITSSGG